MSHSQQISLSLAVSNDTVVMLDISCLGTSLALLAGREYIHHKPCTHVARVGLFDNR
jgi:hypothetical protein